MPVASAIPSASSVSVASASASASGDVAHGERVSAGLTGESKVVGVVGAAPLALRMGCLHTCSCEQVVVVDAVPIP